jgi:copper(I)-binding protein
LAIPRFVLSQGPSNWVSDELLVGLRPAVSQVRAQAIYHAHGAVFTRPPGAAATAMFRAPPFPVPL